MRRTTLEFVAHSTDVNRSKVIYMQARSFAYCTAPKRLLPGGTQSGARQLGDPVALP